MWSISNVVKTECPRVLLLNYIVQSADKKKELSRAHEQLEELETELSSSVNN